MELRAVDVGRRSTLYVSREGALYRNYHDTSTWDGPLPLHVDGQGVARCSRNRRLDHVVCDAFTEEAHVSEAAQEGSTDEQQVGGGGGPRFRGDAVVGAQRKEGSMNVPPPHLHKALGYLAREPRTVQEFARSCDVEVSTAWNYAARVVEYWPAAHTVATSLVYPPLLRALYEVSSRTGRLRDLMERLEVEATSLRGDVEWRCARDRYEQLRLARLCVEASIGIEATRNAQTSAEL